MHYFLTSMLYSKAVASIFEVVWSECGCGYNIDVSRRSSGQGNIELNFTDDDKLRIITKH